MGRMILVIVAGIILLVLCRGEFFSGGYRKLPPKEQNRIRQNCLADLDRVINEADRRLQYASYYGDWRAIQVYSPLAYQLVEMRQRVLNPYCDPTAEETEIRRIQAMLIQGR